MASPTQWTWVWVSPGRRWRTGRPVVLRSMGSQRVGHDWMTEQPNHEIRLEEVSSVDFLPLPGDGRMASCGSHEGARTQSLGRHSTRRSAAISTQHETFDFAKHRKQCDKPWRSSGKITQHPCFHTSILQHYNYTLYQKHYSSVDSQADINISVSTMVAFLKPCVWRVLSPGWWQRSFPTGKKVRVRTRTIQDRETLRGPRPSGRTAPGPQTPDGCPHGHGGDGRKRLPATPIVIQLWFFSNLKLLSIL